LKIHLEAELDLGNYQDKERILDIFWQVSGILPGAISQVAFTANEPAMCIVVFGASCKAKCLLFCLVNKWVFLVLSCKKTQIAYQ
jgi:hypothetical protein